MLVQGPKQNDMEQADWSIAVRSQAALIHYFSPYPEVRSVTQPFDDPSIPVETLRAYFLGLAFQAGSTALSSFFEPRQPAISLSPPVLQLLLAPCGKLMAKIVPDWTLTVRGRRLCLNPGPWSLKEHVFATIMFTVAGTASGVYDVFLVQRLPQYLNQQWVTYGYEIGLGMATNFLGFGLAGVIRRFVVYCINHPRYFHPSYRRWSLHVP